MAPALSGVGAPTPPRLAWRPSATPKQRAACSAPLASHERWSDRGSETALPPPSPGRLTLGSRHVTPPAGRANFLNLSSQCASRYLLHLDGNAYSAGLKYKLACGSLVLKVHSGFDEFYYPGLVPNEHFVPVKAVPNKHVERRMVPELLRLLEEAKQLGHHPPLHVLVGHGLDGHKVLVRHEAGVVELVEARVHLEHERAARELVLEPGRVGVAVEVEQVAARTLRREVEKVGAACRGGHVAGAQCEPAGRRWRERSFGPAVRPPFVGRQGR